MTPTINHWAGPDRRRHRPLTELRRCLFGLVYSLHIATAERMLTWFQVCLACGVMALQKQILATPPPLIQGYVLTLPAPVWSVLLLIGVFWQLRYRDFNCPCRRRDGAAFSLFVLGALVPPLFLRGPGLACFVLGAFFWQLMLVAALHDQCRRLGQRER